MISPELFVAKERRASRREEEDRQAAPKKGNHRTGQVYRSIFAVRNSWPTISDGSSAWMLCVPDLWEPVAALLAQ
jgi:hypothetical protein